ncbi:MAG TPA: hypothetical protein PLZ86_03615 [bacterium]|nr:hypothetical protein [bacterium]
MAEVKGKFITMTGGLMAAYPAKLEEANRVLVNRTGRGWNELDPEGWYDTSLFSLFIEAYAESLPSRDEAIVTLGKKVYPTIKRTAGLPDYLKRPLDFITYEAEGFLANHRGAGVVPRDFVRIAEKNVIVRAPAPGYSAKLFEGVYLGILLMCGVTSGMVTQTKSTERGDATDEFDIRW